VARFLAACPAAIFVLSTAPCLAQIGLGAGVRIAAPAHSMRDLRDLNVVKQRYDFSCGAAALATLLRFGFGENVTENQILADLFDLPSEAEKSERRRTGFSLLDLQRVAQARGYNAQGFRLEASQLPLLGGPVIVFIEPRGYKHFAVLSGVRGDRAYLADPSRGQVRQPAHVFRDSWLQDDGRGIIFVVEPKSGLPSAQGSLTVSGTGRPLPEILSVRELIAIGNRLMPQPGGRE
jgi:predicted double-glycine peptidase